MKQLMQILLGVALATASYGAPIQWTVASGGNGHYYEYVPAISIFDPVSFGVANADAISRSYLGEPGYLVTITSNEEHLFLLSSFSFLYGFGGGSGFWIGATDEAVEGEFRWLGGPEAGQALSYTLWSPGSPNSEPANNDYVQVVLNASNPLNGQWTNTVPNGAFGYVIEYGGTNATNAVPEPATFGLCAAAAAGALCLRKRQRV